MGVAYSQIAQLEEDLQVLENRLEKKIKILNENEDRIVEIEKELATIKSCKNDR